ncbi:MAG: hypothetical protein ACHQFX_14750 [Chitinophagales bacterium]
MRYIAPFTLLFILISNFCYGQTARSIRVKAGEDVAQAYSPQGFYRFPQFGKATLHFRSGIRSSSVLFNYNMLSGALQFISPKGDTLDLANAADLDSVAFEKTTFIFNNGFFEIVSQSDSIRLLKKVVLSSQYEDIGAYGRPNPTGSITNIKEISVRGAVYSLIVNQDIVLTEDVTWFLMRAPAGMIKANKTNLLKMLPAEKQGKTETYLKQNKISFQQENDLKRLFEAIRG